ncbi:MAG: flagellar protein FlaG [Spirochaetes bacterium]|nr:flagellar protein FlaG [Spirochaetota bacterium]
MSIEVDALNKERIYNIMMNNLTGNKTVDQQTISSEKTIDSILNLKNENFDIEKIQIDLNKMLDSLNFLDKKIKLSYNDDINRVIITIMDKETNEVVKQFPSVELQNLAEHLKKAIGILFDKFA